MTSNAASRMPANFIGHGTPLNAFRVNRWTEGWRQLGRQLSQPQSILAISGHWCTRGTHVTAMASPPTIHDFYGFPPELHQIAYPAPGDPALAQSVRELLEPIAVRPDVSWDLDHGTWVVLSKLFPAADIPVIQLSLDMTQSARFHYDTGRRLRPLRDAGVLILGTGNVVHNLRARVQDHTLFAHDWASRFNTHIRDAIVAHDHDQIINYESFGRDALMSVPTPDHYYPLLYILGAGGDDPVSIELDRIERGAVSMLSVLCGQKKQQHVEQMIADAQT
jgi:4,5-DOPA dioxygenase extradiol